jgi:hypothetical protein
MPKAQSLPSLLRIFQRSRLVLFAIRSVPQRPFDLLLADRFDTTFYREPKSLGHRNSFILLYACKLCCFILRCGICGCSIA